jgi:hypothetical protein
MFKFLKKKDPVVDSLEKLDQLKWIKEVLLDYNLLNVNTLIDMAEIQAKKQSKESLKFILNLLQPKLIKKLNSGEKSAWVEISREEFEQHNGPILAIRQELLELGIDISLRIDNFYTKLPGEQNMYSASIFIFKPLGKKGI